MLGIKKMPVSLNEAIKLAKNSKFIDELLGTKLKENYIEQKEAEYDEYRRIVSKWEIDRYLVQY
jgi:glutamine synthetase